MKSHTLPGHDDAAALVASWQSPRSKRLMMLQRWVEGTQYDHLKGWFEDCETPLFDRAPCIVYPFAQSAIDAHVDMILGEGRFPSLTCGSTDNDSPWSNEDKLDDEARTKVDRFIVECIRQARFEALGREALAAAMGCGSACLVFGRRGTRLAVDRINAAWCEPELDADGNVERLVVQYPYIEQYQDVDNGTWRARARLFRREIDEQRDTTYVPAILTSDSLPGAFDWQPDEARDIPHGLGFCPVVWYPFDRGSSVEGRIDGKAMHAHVMDEIHAHDFALSLRHRAAVYAGEPQWTETGVEPGYNPSTTAPVADGVGATPKGGDYTGPGGDNPLKARYTSPLGRSQGRRKSPGLPWQYGNPAAKVDLHFLPGTALQAITEHARDIRIKLAESVGVVFLDPGDIKYASSLSGKALEVLQRRQLARDNSIRADVEDGMLVPSVRMLLRIVATMGDALRIPGLGESLDLLSKWSEDTEDAIPDPGLIWPSYFDVGIDEIKPVSETVRADLEAGVITRETAIRKLADFYGIEDVDAYLETLQAERDDAMAKQQQQMHDAAKLLEEQTGDDMNDDDADDPDGQEPTGDGPPPAERGKRSAGGPPGSGSRGKRAP